VLQNNISEAKLISTAFYYTFKFVLILWMALPQTAYVIPRIYIDWKLTPCSGAQIVFRSFLQPVFSRYFSESGSTAANLRAKADSAGKPHAS
jgi:receptor expression-enhancing protein 5/6